jgi:hypothetical protein
VNEFDRVFERDDVNGFTLVDLVQQRGQGRGLAGTGGARDEDQTGFFLGDLLENRGHLQILESRNAGVQLTQNHRIIAALREDVHAEACLAGDAMRAITGTGAKQVFGQSAAAGHQVEGHHFGLKRGELVNIGLDGDGRQLPRGFDLERFVDSDVEIGHVLVRVQHRAQNLIEFFSSHGGGKARES